MYVSLNSDHSSIFMCIWFMILLIIPYNLSSPLVSFKDEDKEQCCELSNNPNHVQFFLFPDAGNPSFYKEIIYNDEESLLDSHFQPNLQTIIITHGLRSDVSSPSCQNIKNALLQYDPNFANILVASWGPLATPIPLTLSLNWYTHVLANVPIVGERVGNFIKFLVEQNAANLSSIYLIGHSLGAHVMALAGKQIQKDFGNQKVQRITGLDPALAGYWPEKNNKNLVQGDASFVDIIHTNAGKLGMIGQCGHADFYPNGGSHQPGCEVGDHSTPNSLPGSCSHEYSHILYAQSIKKPFFACPCNSFKPESPESECSSKCDNPVIMGFHAAITTRGEFYLTTESILPTE